MTVLLAATSDGVVRITESGDAWSVGSVLDGGRGQCICVDPRDPSRVFVGSHGRGLWRSADGGAMLSEDGGETWKDHRPGAQPDCHALAWHPEAEGRAYEAAGGGAAWSSDAGETWRGGGEGRDRHYTWALAVDPYEPDPW